MAKTQDPVAHEPSVIVELGLEELTHVSGGEKTGGGRPPTAATVGEAPKRPSFGRIINGMLGGSDK